VGGRCRTILTPPGYSDLGLGHGRTAGDAEFDQADRELAPTWTAFSDYTGPDLLCSMVFHF